MSSAKRLLKPLLKALTPAPSEKERLLWSFAKHYPWRILAAQAFGFSGALFTGVSTALIVPVVLSFLGQDISTVGLPPILQALLAPFDALPPAYRDPAMALSVVLAIGLKNLATYLSLLISGSLQRSLASDLRQTGVQLLLDVNLSYHANTRMGDMTNRLGNEIGRVSSAIASFLQLITAAITVLFMASLLLALSWKLTLVSTVLFSAVIGVNQYFIARSRQFGKRLSLVSKNYSVALIEVLNGIRLVKSACTEEREYDRLHGLIRSRERAEFQSTANVAAIPPVSETLSVSVLMGIVVLSRVFFADAVADLSTVLLTYLSLLFRLLPQLSQINRLRSNLANNAASVEVVHDFLRRDNKEFTDNGTVPFTGIADGIRFDRVDFAYLGSSDLALKGIDLFVPRGTTLALVGGSGAGKSTLVDLVPRFADPVAGRIEIDGRDLREFDLASLRRSMGIVSQDTFLFNDTVRNNIAYGCPEATESDVIQAAKRANALEFIEQLPRGFETPMGDRGVMLSGGQRQRIAIARALLRNPPILILDEATSALDTVSERLVQEAIENLSRDRTTLVIAHRLSTVQNADQIAVMEKGEVVEVGSHEELLARDGRYAELYKLQFSDKADRQPAKSLAIANETFNRTSYEIRTRLNVTLGSLQLLVDDLIDSDRERQELLQESYKSSIRMLSTMELFEDSLQMQKSQYVQQTGGKLDDAVQARLETFSQVSYDVRTRLNATIGALRFLIDGLADSDAEAAQMLRETYQAVIHILDVLESLESTRGRA